MASNCSGVLPSSRGGLAPPGRALRRADARLRDASRHMSGCGAYCIEIVDRIEIVEVVIIPLQFGVLLLFCVARAAIAIYAFFHYPPLSQLINIPKWGRCIHAHLPLHATHLYVHQPPAPQILMSESKPPVARTAPSGDMTMAETTDSFGFGLRCAGILCLMPPCVHGSHMPTFPSS